MCRLVVTWVAELTPATAGVSWRAFGRAETGGVRGWRHLHHYSAQPGGGSLLRAAEGHGRLRQACKATAAVPVPHAITAPSSPAQELNRRWANPLRDRFMWWLPVRLAPLLCLAGEPPMRQRTRCGAAPAPLLPTPAGGAACGAVLARAAGTHAGAAEAGPLQGPASRWERSRGPEADLVPTKAVASHAATASCNGSHAALPWCRPALSAHCLTPLDAPTEGDESIAAHLLRLKDPHTGQPLSGACLATADTTHAMGHVLL